MLTHGAPPSGGVFVSGAFPHPLLGRGCFAPAESIEAARIISPRACWRLGAAGCPGPTVSLLNLEDELTREALALISALASSVREDVRINSGLWDLALALAA